MGLQMVKMYIIRRYNIVVDNIIEQINQSGVIGNSDGYRYEERGAVVGIATEVSI